MKAKPASSPQAKREKRKSNTSSSMWTASWTAKEVLEEKVIKEPVKEVVLRGTLVQETPAPDYSGGSSSGGVGTFVDYNGNVVSYSGLLTGDCTAYSVPGGTTSLVGMPFTA